MYALLITDDADRAAFFSALLQRVGLAVTTAAEVEQAMQSWAERPVDVILVALADRLPVESIRRIRLETPAPLVIAVPQADEESQAELLRQGADMVITPPYYFKLLVAQIEALLRRGSHLPLFSLPTFSAAGLELNPMTREVSGPYRGVQRLTQLEFRLLYTLILNRGQIIPTETIVERVWGYTGQGDRELVRGLVSRLRLKIEANPRQPEYILNVPGVGYMFRADE